MMKQIALALTVLMLAGCGAQVRPMAPAIAPVADLAAQAAKSVPGKLSASAQAQAIKIINADFINSHFEKGPGGKGWWIPNPSEEGDGVVVKKVTSGFKNFKFTPGAAPKVLDWTADQDCLDQDMQPFTTHCTGTVDLASKKVTYNFK